MSTAEWHALQTLNNKRYIMLEKYNTSIGRETMRQEETGSVETQAKQHAAQSKRSRGVGSWTSTGFKVIGALALLRGVDCREPAASPSNRHVHHRHHPHATPLPYGGLSPHPGFSPMPYGAGPGPMPYGAHPHPGKPTAPTLPLPPTLPTTPTPTPQKPVPAPSPAPSLYYMGPH